MLLHPVGSIQVLDYQDFLLSLSENSVDLILTDPPYNISRKTNFTNTQLDKYKNYDMDFGAWDKIAIDLDALVRLSYRALRYSGTLIVWYDLWKITELADAMTRNGFSMLRFIEWQKVGPVPVNSKKTYLSNSREIAVVCVKGSNPTFNSKYDNGVYSYPIPRPQKRFHPTMKSLPLFRELVRKHSNSGDFVVDPFLGSGTTAFASLYTGRSFSGCDINADYITAIDKLLGGKHDSDDITQS